MVRKIELYRRERRGCKSVNVPLGIQALVDDEDYEKITQFHSNWRLHSAGYACCTKSIGGKSIVVLMHRLILNLTDPQIHTDHIDHNRLNNTRKNIRAVTQAENNANLPYSGVGKLGNRWRAWSRFSSVHLGVFDTKQEAEQAIRLWDDKGIRAVVTPQPPTDLISPCCQASMVRNGKYTHKDISEQRYRCTSCKKTLRESAIP